MAAKKTKKQTPQELLDEYAAKPVSRLKDHFLNTGDSLFNLACSDRLDGGYPLGRMISLRGLSHAGKSLLSLTALSEAVRDPFFDDYLIILNDTEAAYQFDTEKMFGKRLAKRIRIVNQKSAEVIYVTLMQMINDGVKFIYIIDSFDSVTTAQDGDSFAAIKKAVESDKLADAHKTFGMFKAKFSNDIFRNVSHGLEKTESLLINVSQTKEDIGKYGHGDKRRVSGGKGLDYYSSVTAWCKQIKAETVEVEGDKYIVWTKTEVDITKNRVTGKRRKATLVLDYEFGVDHIRGGIHYLMDHGEIKTQGVAKVWGDLEIPQKRDPDDKRKILANSEEHLIEMIENDPELEKKLAADIAKVWERIEATLKKTSRRSKYE